MINFKDAVTLRRCSNYPEELAFVTESPERALILRVSAEIQNPGDPDYKESIVVLLPPDVVVKPGDTIVYAGKSYAVMNLRNCMNLLGEVLAQRLTVAR